MSAIDPAQMHPKLRRLFEHWRAVHPRDGMPGRQHFEPITHADLLPNIKLVEVHGLRLRYRLLGTGIDAALGRSVAEQWVDAVHASHPNWPLLLADYRHVIDKRTPLWRRGPPHVVTDENCTTVETLRLPLAGDGQTVDMVLGLTLLFDQTNREIERSRLSRR
jgi:hypothetical protein